jgi:hypothetical protein
MDECSVDIKGEDAAAESFLYGVMAFNWFESDVTRSDQTAA